MSAGTFTVAIVESRCGWQLRHFVAGTANHQGRRAGGSPIIKSAMLTARFTTLLALAALSLLAGCNERRPSDPADVKAIQAVMRMTWDKPDAPLTVEPVEVVGHFAVADWSQPRWRAGRCCNEAPTPGRWCCARAMSCSIRRSSKQQELPLGRAFARDPTHAGREVDVSSSSRAHRKVPRLGTHGVERARESDAMTIGEMHGGTSRSFLRLLSTLRWLAVGGQLITILVVTGPVGVKLPMAPLWAGVLRARPVQSVYAPGAPPARRNRQRPNSSRTSLDIVGTHMAGRLERRHRESLRVPVPVADRAFRSSHCHPHGSG